MPQASKMFLGENLFQSLFRLSVKSQKRNDQQTFHLRITSVAHKNEHVHHQSDMYICNLVCVFMVVSRQH